MTDNDCGANWNIKQMLILPGCSYRKNNILYTWNVSRHISCPEIICNCACICTCSLHDCHLLKKSDNSSFSLSSLPLRADKTGSSVVWRSQDTWLLPISSPYSILLYSTAAYLNISQPVAWCVRHIVVNANNWRWIREEDAVVQNIRQLLVHWGTNQHEGVEHNTVFTVWRLSLCWREDALSFTTVCFTALDCVPHSEWYHLISLTSFLSWTVLSFFHVIHIGGISVLYSCINPPCQLPSVPFVTHDKYGVSEAIGSWLFDLITKYMSTEVVSQPSKGC